MNVCNRHTCSEAEALGSGEWKHTLEPEALAPKNISRYDFTLGEAEALGSEEQMGICSISWHRRL